MHPIERLRYVARASGVPSASLVRETASGLAPYADDRATLLTACRRMIVRQPRSAAVVTLAARMITAGDSRSAAREFIEELENDATATELSFALPEGAVIVVLGWPDITSSGLVWRGDVEARVVDVHGEGRGLVARLLDADVPAVDVPVEGVAAAIAGADIVLLEAAAVGPTQALVLALSGAAAAVAKREGAEVWMIAGVGTWLPQQMWDAMSLVDDGDEPWHNDEELMSLDLVDKIAGPDGLTTVTAALRGPHCPVAPELFVT